MFDCSEKELQTIDQQLDPILGYAKIKVAETQQLALDATRLLSCTEDRFNEYQGQGFFKRCWSSLCGKTGEIQRSNQKDLILMQKYSWRYINLLQERDLLLGHSLLTVKNNLLTLAINEEETRKEIARMAERISGRFEVLEDRMKNVEVATKIHGWLLTIGTRDYDEKYPPHFRLLRLIKDFLSLKESDWNINEIRFLQTALERVGLPWKRKITLSEFIGEIIEEIECSTFLVYQDLLFITSGKSGGFIPESFIIENIAVPSFNSLFNLASNYSGTSNTIEILCDQLSVTRNDALKKVLFTYIKKQGIDLEIKLPLRDLTVELLSCMRLSQNLFNTGNQGSVTNLTNDSTKADNRFSTIDTASDSNENLASLFKLAEKGDRDAQYNLGNRYEYADEVDLDLKEALTWFLRAAEQGHVKAQSQLASLYYYGLIEGEKSNYQEAFKWAKKAAGLGEVDAQHLVAMMYELGEGVEEDQSEALHWYTCAASQGHNGSNYSLGIMYYYGNVVPRNYTKAFELINKSCSGEPSVIELTQLATMHLLGRGTNNSYSETKKIIMKIKEMLRSDENSIWSKTDIIENVLDITAAFFEDGSNFYTTDNIPAGKKSGASETFLKPFKKNERIYLFYDDTFWGGASDGFAISKKMFSWCSEGMVVNAPFEWKGFKSPVLNDDTYIVFNDDSRLSLASSGLDKNKKQILMDLIKMLHIISID